MLHNCVGSWRHRHSGLHTVWQQNSRLRGGLHRSLRRGLRIGLRSVLRRRMSIGGEWWRRKEPPLALDEPPQPLQLILPAALTRQLMESGEDAHVTSSATHFGPTVLRSVDFVGLIRLTDHEKRTNFRILSPRTELTSLHSVRFRDYGSGSNARAISPGLLEKRVKEEAPDTRVQCRMVSIRYLLKYENAREINPHGHCRLLDALWLFRHLMGERLGLRGDGCTYLRNQPCAIRIAHFREEKQKEKVCLFEKRMQLTSV